MGLLSTIGAASGRAFGLTRVGVLKDLYFNLTTLLLPGNGTNGAQNNTFLDSSTNNFTITRNGNTTQGTFSPFSQTGWGNYFGGSQSINAAASADFQLTGDFTIEGWVYTTSTSDASLVVQQSSSNYFALNVQGGTGLNIYLNSATATISPTDRVPALNTWNHVALVRSGTGSGNVKIYLNGVASSTTATNTSTLGYNALFYVGAIGTNSSGSFVGYISNVRVVNGTALYTNNFTPSATPLTDVANTKLLTCQSNRFIDTNTQVTAKTITVNGSPSVQAFSPFAPTAEYSAATVGGSGYFDGTGDYLTVADNAALEPVGNNFCIEFSYYPTSVSGTKTIVGKRSNPSTDYGFLVLADGANARVYISSANTSYDIVNGTIIGTLVTNQWHHIAIYRISNAWYASFNGSITTLNASNSSSVNNNAGTWGIGADSNGAAPVQGYMANTRFVIGSSVYTSTSAPFPTAPLTAITNTQLLLNYTNAGITDATAKNDLETVGNAQISTTQSKFGGSSMYFDGTGDWLIVPNNAFYNFGSGDFTIEFWWYPNTTADQNLISKWNSATEWILQWRNAGNFRWAANGSVVRDATYTLSTGAWIHVAVSCASGSLRIFVNGTQIGTTATQSSITTTTEPVVIGAGQLSTTPAPVNGYFDDVRITRFARYTSNFTAPTAAFPVQ